MLLSKFTVCNMKKSRFTKNLEAKQLLSSIIEQNCLLKNFTIFGTLSF